MMKNKLKLLKNKYDYLCVVIFFKYIVFVDKVETYLNYKKAQLFKTK